MADSKLSALTATTTLTDSDELYVNDGGVSKKITKGNFDDNIDISLSQVNDVTATAAELNTLSGVTATATELNYTDGVTSAIQTQLNTKAVKDNPTFTGEITEETYFSSVATSLNPANGTMQVISMSGNRTFTSALTAGQSLTLMVNPGTFTVTWPTINWVGGSAPTLTASKYNTIVLWNEGTTLYGSYVGAHS